ncbi:hypothetical protein LXL04_015371 [Taraxacum kok-saghyz]
MGLINFPIPPSTRSSEDALNSVPADISSPGFKPPQSYRFLSFTRVKKLSYLINPVVGFYSANRGQLQHDPGPIHPMFLFQRLPDSSFTDIASFFSSGFHLLQSPAGPAQYLCGLGPSTGQQSRGASLVHRVPFQMKSYVLFANCSSRMFPVSILLNLLLLLYLSNFTAIPISQQHFLTCISIKIGLQFRNYEVYDSIQLTE